MKRSLPLVFTLLVAAAPAQKMGTENDDAPKLTQTFVAGKDINLQLEYEAITWAKGEMMTALADPDSGAAARERINQKAASNPLGKFSTRRAITLGSERVESGSYDLAFTIDDDIKWHLTLSSKRFSGGKLDWKLNTTQADRHLTRLSISIAPVDVAAGPELTAGAELWLGFGKMRASLTVAPAQTLGAKDPALTQIRAFIDEKKIDTSAKDWKLKLPKPPMLQFSEDKNYYWNMRTNQGPIKVRLMPTVAPMHVSSTIYLAELGFYDNLSFHRVIQRFMAQGGCPLGNGMGGPGYSYSGEFSDEIKHTKPGMLSMANAGPGTDGSQFFLTFVPTPHLDGRHTIFGEVVEGMDAVKKLEQNGSRNGQTKRPLSIEESYITVE